MSKGNTSRRTRNYATVVYPESASSDWIEVLERFVVPAFVSPLHDKDVNPNGEPKKPHYHVMIMFDSVKTQEQAKEIFDAIGGVGCEVVNSVRGYARYLCHLDNPEKAQYDKSEVRSLSSADYLNVIGLPIDKYVAIQEMMDFVDENGNWSYADLLRYARKERKDWFQALCDSCTYVMKEYCKSAYWTEREEHMEGR